MRYQIKVKSKKSWFWNTYKAKGHQMDLERNRLVIYIQDNGGLISLTPLSDYSIKLGQDWELATKEKMEEEAGQEVKLKKD